jgi:hypothetical protein
VVELADPARTGAEGIGVDRHRDVGSLAGHGGSFAVVQESPADLYEGIGPALGRRAVILGA